MPKRGADTQLTKDDDDNEAAWPAAENSVRGLFWIVKDKLRTEQLEALGEFIRNYSGRESHDQLRAEFDELSRAHANSEAMYKKATAAQLAGRK